MSNPIRAWCLYDVGHSAFAATIMSAVLPIYFSSVAAVDLDPDPERARLLATSWWGYANTTAMAIAALSAPWLGALADAGHNRKRWLIGFAVSGSFVTALLSTVGQGDWILAFWLYVIGRIAFSNSLVFYDSMLPHLVDEPSQMNSVSTRGYAWGYLGGGLLLAVQLAIITFSDRFGFADSETATRVVFVSAGVWWLLFTLPLARAIHDPPAVERSRARVGDAFGRLATTLREIRSHREAFKFLVAFWLYNDGVGTIVVMATVFGSELGLERTTLIGAILAVNILGFPFSLMFGRLARRFGAKPSLLAALAGYSVLCVLGYFMRTAAHFWLLALGVSVVQGGTQALSRSLFAGMIPPTRSSEFFGFYDVSSKFAGVLGPLIFAIVGQQLGSSRYGVLALIVLFAAGAWVLTRVHPELSRGRLGQQT